MELNKIRDDHLQCILLKMSRGVVMFGFVTRLNIHANN